MSRTRSRKSKVEFVKGSEAEDTFSAINKKYGDVVRRGSEITQPERISSGSFIFDLATLGGIPDGRQNMILGEKHAGKTTMACKIMAHAQRRHRDKLAVVLDCEKAFDTVWAAKLGVDLDRLMVVESEVGEAAVDMADAMLATEEVCILTIDSLAAMLPAAEAKASAEDNHVGLQSRLIGELCRKMGSTLMHERMRGHSPSVLYINQFRIKIGQMFGDNRTSPGGKAVEHFPSIVWRMLNKEIQGKDDRDNELIIHNEHSFAITKNKLNNGPRHGEFRLCRNNNNDQGLVEGDIDDSKTVLTYAKKFGVFNGGGKTWRLEYEGNKFKFDSPAKGAEYLNKNRGVYRSIYNFLIREQALSFNMPDEFLSRFDVDIHEDSI